MPHGPGSVGVHIAATILRLNVGAECGLTLLDIISKAVILPAMKTKFYPKAIPGESRWVDYDDEVALWCVFGTESGHAYSSHASEDDAQATLDKTALPDKVVA